MKHIFLTLILLISLCGTANSQPRSAPQPSSSIEGVTLTGWTADSTLTYATVVFPRLTSSGYATYPPANVFDGNEGNYYVSENACVDGVCTGLWIQLNLSDFEGGYITGIRFFTHATYAIPANITIFTSNTGAFAGEEVEGDTFAYTRGADTAWSDWVSFPGIRGGKYIRFMVNTLSSATTGQRIREVQFKIKQKVTILDGVAQVVVE